ncbi:MAG: hypothetical protein JNK74_11665 [Candidatus Hydrogenedentes bacterium]|nr:hypothetical protein [Candidatus Hydrogenedentota bacterium]
MRFSLYSRPLAIAVLVVLLGAVSVPAQPKQATSENALSGSYFAHDLFEINDDSQHLGRGFRVFTANGVMSRLSTYPSSTSLDFEIKTDATFRLFTTSFNSGFNGTVGLGGDLAVFTYEAAPNADAQVRDGYASLQISVKQSSGLDDDVFESHYSYHALLRTSNDAYRTSFGGATADGSGQVLVVRESETARIFNYNVTSDGRVALMGQDSGNAAIVDSGALIVNTADVAAGDDGEINGGYTGLALYVRRFPANDGATTDDFRGTYRVHRIRANGSATPASDVGTVIAGGNGIFIGELGGQDYGGQIDLNASGTFTLVGSNAFQGTLGAGGDLAVITTIGGSNPFLEIWVRTAGGAGNALDSDGDGLTDDEEGELDTDPDDADSDNDGLLDNADERPNTADNVVDATLSRNNIIVDEGASAITNVTLTLDSDDFPFFEWEVSSAADWISFDPDSGIGDETISLEIDIPALEASPTPYEALINIDALEMRDVPPLTLSVTVNATQVDLALNPEALNFTVEEGGAKASGTVRLSSPDANVFAWTAATEYPWITVTPRLGGAATDVTIEVNPESLLAENSPYIGTVIFRPGGAGPKQKALTVTANVVPERDIDVPFYVAESNVAQSRPAAAFDESTSIWTIAWVEDQQIHAALFDENLVPLTQPAQVSLTAFGIATNPTVVAVSEEGESWVIWEQYATGSTSALLQAKAYNLDSRSPGNVFGFSASPGSKTMPQAVYNIAANEVAIAFGQEVENDAFAGLIRVNAASRGVLSSGFAAPSNDPQSVPAIAWLEDVNEYLIAWREDIPVDDTTSTQVRAARLAGNTGAVLGEVIVIDEDAPSAANIAVAASTGLNRWIVAWAEEPSTLNTVAVDAAGTASSPAPFDGVQQSETPVALGYNGNSKQAILLWSRDPAAGDPVAVYRTAAGNGRALGEIVPLPDGPATVNSVAASANAAANEFLLIWEDPETIPRQLRALRVAGGSDDVDEDGLPNDWELEYGLDPASAEGDDGPAGDPDRDGLNNLAEFTLGTDPTNPDSDGDGLFDGQEDRDSDGTIGDGETSPLNTDSDGDGATDDVEWFLGSDGSDESSHPDSGIYRVSYGAWTPGQTGELSVSFYIAEAGDYALTANAEGGAPDGWTVTSEVDGEAHAYAVGAHTIVYAITPAAELTPATAYAPFAFRLSGDGVSSERTSVLVADLLETLRETTSVSAETLAQTYAPVLRLHRDAIFSPMPVEVSLGTATLDLGNTMTLVAQPRDFDLGQSTHREAFIDLPGTNTEALFDAYPPAESLPEPRLYYTVTTLGDRSSEAGADPDHISIQYYLHFFADVWGLDQQGGHRHEGDWEVFQILLDEDQVPYRAATTQQWQLANLDETVPGGEGRDWADVEVTEGARPVLYVGQGGNSLYFEPGATRYEAGSELHDGMGHWLLPEGLEGTDYGLQIPLNLSPLGRLHEADTPRWLPFAGAWGQPNFPIPDTDDGDPAINDGPLGPVFLGTTLDPNSENGVARIWSDPFAFANRMPALPQGLTTQVRGTVPEPFWGKTLLLLDSRGRVYSGEIVMGNGAFDITVPLQPLLLAVVDYDDYLRPTLLAASRFTAGSRQTPLFPTVPDITSIGALALTDGVLTGEANYPFVDSDGDGTPNADDLDMDEDGIDNGNDLDVLGDGWDDGFQAQDPDEDGIPSYLDGDDDGDGTADAEDADRDGSGTPDVDEAADVDGDGFVDALDLDIDNDGFDNATEEAAGSDPRHYLDTPTSQVGDLDEDGEVDAADGQQLINLGLGRSAYTPRADYNLNGYIDAVDLQSLINEILAGGK